MISQVTALNITEYLLDSVLMTGLFAIGSTTRKRKHRLCDGPFVATSEGGL